MDRVFKQRWKTILFFTVLAALMVGVFYGAYHGPWDPRFRRRMEKYQVQPAQAPRVPQSFIRNGKMTLLLERPLSTPELKLVYHGIDDGRIHLAVFVLAMDPEFGYHHHIDIGRAKKGFRLGGQLYRLEACNQKRIRLEMP